MTIFPLYFRGQKGTDKKGLGTIAPHDLQQGDDEFDAYRKRMMMAYRFRPNPLVKNCCLRNKSCHNIFVFFVSVAEQPKTSILLMMEIWKEQKNTDYGMHCCAIKKTFERADIQCLGHLSKVTTFFFLYSYLNNFFAFLSNNCFHLHVDVLANFPLGKSMRIGGTDSQPYS